MSCGKKRLDSELSRKRTLIVSCSTCCTFGGDATTVTCCRDTLGGDVSASVVRHQSVLTEKRQTGRNTQECVLEVIKKFGNTTRFVIWSPNCLVSSFEMDPPKECVSFQIAAAFGGVCHCLYYSFRRWGERPGVVCWIIGCVVYLLLLLRGMLGGCCLALVSPTRIGEEKTRRVCQKPTDQKGRPVPGKAKVMDNKAAPTTIPSGTDYPRGIPWNDYLRRMAENKIFIYVLH